MTRDGTLVITTDEEQMMPSQSQGDQLELQRVISLDTTLIMTQVAVICQWLDRKRAQAILA